MNVIGFLTGNYFSCVKRLSIPPYGRPGGPHSDVILIFHVSSFIFDFLIFTSPFSFSVKLIRVLFFTFPFPFLTF